MSIMSSIKALGPVGLRCGQILKAKAPTILVVTGILSGVSSGVIAVKRSPLCGRVKEQFDENVERANACLEKGKVETNDGQIITYDEARFRNDLRIIHAQKYYGYLKVYAPAFVLGVVSVGAILWSHGIMMKRNAALTATVATISEAFNRYRKNVKDEFGDEVDHRMRHSLVCEKEKVKEKDPETGKEKTVTKEKLVRKKNASRSDYARCFDESCRGWSKDASANRVNLMGYQTWANQRLRSRGYLFLNEIYELFDIDTTLAGSEMGWVYTKDDEDNQYGDNFVDFGFDKDPYFMSGQERSVWLDFNVDERPIRERIKWAIK